MASVTDGFTYDVFLSFRGEDTRYRFTGNLWKALNDRGIRTFMDDDELRKGEEITSSLIKAIEQSRMAIIVLSKNYASSSFCLQELLNILHCIKDKGRSVWPIFYDVDPSDVRKLKRTYGEAMAKLETTSSNDGLQKWKKSLHQVSNLSGFDFKNWGGYEHEFIGNIVEQVSKEIKPLTLAVADHLVGLQPQKQYVTSLLNVGFDDKVHMVGIHGIGGIGKTTLAQAVYNSTVHQFQASCFLEKVRENSKKHGLTFLQQILLYDIVGEKEKLSSVEQGISVIKQRLRHKKVLLLLDDVDDKGQLHAIAGRPEWFGLGSRVIITTRDKRLLTCHGVEITYEVQEMNKKDAFELLQRKTFKTDEICPSYADVLNRALTYASGLPLALEVLGSHLFNKTVEQCESALGRYERIPDNKIQTILKVSFDALEEEEQSVFLDIACCFRGYELAVLEKILHAHHGDCKKDHINVLVEKSLIKISESGNVTLHDLIEDMGKEIVRQESPKEPGKRSRLWSPKDIVQVFEENTGTSKIEIIYLDSLIEVKWDGEAFKEMENLRTLIIYDGQFSKSPKHLPNSLRILQLRLSPSWDLPPDFYPKKLAICLFSSPFTSRVWGDFFKKKFENMRALYFHYCGSLEQTVDISGLLNLEEFSVKNCWNLVTFDDSISLMGKLRILSIERCNQLRNIPPIKLASLEELVILYCGSLESLSLVMDGSMGELKILNVQGCSKLKSIPPLELPSLEKLDLSDCDSLENFPHVVDGLMDKLKILRVKNCRKLKNIPPIKLASLEELDLSQCRSLGSFGSFPHVVDGLMDKLKILRAKNCNKLKNIPPIKSASLEELDLSQCLSLESFPHVVDGLMDKLKILCVEHCSKLRRIPSLKLALLEKLDLSYCDSLESLPPLVDDSLEKLKILRISHCSKLRSIPLLNLALLEEIYLSCCHSLESLPPIMDGSLDKLKVLSVKCCNKLRSIPPFKLPSLETLDLSYCGGLESFLSVVDFRGEEKVSPIQYLQIKNLCLCKHNLSDESLAIGLKWFANVEELYLSENKFTILPECIENCHSLWKLILDNCEELQEIKGIPPSLKTLSSLNCKSLIPSCKSKLLNQELHEAGNTWFRLPQANIPDWFEHQWMAGNSISFRFCNKFPVIALCVVSPLTWPWGSDDSPVRVIINGNTFFYKDAENKYKWWLKMPHLHLFHMKMEKFNDNPDKVLLENKWNHAEVDFRFPFQKSGIHVLKEKSSMKDIRFTNPENDANIEFSL